MKHKAFTEIISQTCRVPLSTVALFARNLKEAGLLTSGARGVNAPEMTVLDLTRMIIALCATDRPSDAKDAVERYRVAKSLGPVAANVGGTEITVPAGEELEDMFSSFLKSSPIVINRIDLGLMIHWNRLEAEMSFGDATITFKVALSEDEAKSQFYGSFTGISTRRGLGAHELSEMSVPFFLEEKDGSTWEKMNADGRTQDVVLKHIFGQKGDA